MFDTNDLLRLIKSTAVEAVNASKPADAVFGTVLSLSPMTIQVEQKLVLSQNQLVMTRTVRGYTTGNRSGGSGEASFASHNHTVSGLQVGDKVVLLQVAGGQQYVVLDKVV